MTALAPLYDAVLQLSAITVTKAILAASFFAYQKFEGACSPDVQRLLNVSTRHAPRVPTDATDATDVLFHIDKLLYQHVKSTVMIELTSAPTRTLPTTHVKHNATPATRPIRSPSHATVSGCFASTVNYLPMLLTVGSSVTVIFLCAWYRVLLTPHPSTIHVAEGHPMSTSGETKLGMSIANRHAHTASVSLKVILFNGSMPINPR